MDEALAKTNLFNTVALTAEVDRKAVAEAKKIQKNTPGKEHDICGI